MQQPLPVGFYVALVARGLGTVRAQQRCPAASTGSRETIQYGWVSVRLEDGRSQVVCVYVCVCVCVRACMCGRTLGQHRQTSTPLPAFLSPHSMEVTVVILGQKGVGKSTFISNCLVCTRYGCSLIHVPAHVTPAGDH